MKNKWLKLKLHSGNEGKPQSIIVRSNNICGIYCGAEFATICLKKPLDYPQHTCITVDHTADELLSMLNDDNVVVKNNEQSYKKTMVQKLKKS